MKFFVFNFLERLRLWTLKWASSKHAIFVLFLLAFAEASFFPIPPDVLLIGILAISSQKWWFYAGVSTIGSVLGAFGGYVIGWAFYEGIGRQIVNFYNLQTTIDAIGLKYAENAFLTIFTAAFTPIPFKIITIAAGLFKVPLWSLFIASLIGRGMRFFMVAFIVRVLGRKFNDLVIKYFNILSLAAVLLVILGFIATKFLF